MVPEVGGPGVRKTLNAGHHPGSQLRQLVDWELRPRWFVRDAKAIHSQLLPCFTCTGGTQVRTAVLLAAADDGGRDFPRVVPPLIGARPAARADEVVQRSSPSRHALPAARPQWSLPRSTGTAASAAATRSPSARWRHPRPAPMTSPRPARRPGSSRTASTAPAARRPCARQDQGPVTARRPDDRAARPACGPCAVPAPTAACATPPGGAPSPSGSFELGVPESELSICSRRSSSATRSSSRTSSSRSASSSARSPASPARNAAFSASFASITACSRTTSPPGSPAAPGSGSSGTSPSLLK